MDKIVIATHVFAPGPAQELLKHLLDKRIEKLMFIGHPLFFLKKLTGSGYELYVEGSALFKSYRKITKLSVGLISYPFVVIKNILWTIKYDGQWDLYIGYNNLNALSGVFLKKLGSVKKCIYYVVDYNPNRFKSKHLNKLFHKIELYCANNCDETWNLSQRMIEAREKMHGRVGGKQKVVPMGAWLDRIERVPFDECEQTNVVFMGHILEKQGVQHVIKSIPEVLRKVPDFNLIVIGSGPYLDTLKSLAKDLNVSKHVDFMGFVEDVERDRIISESVLAVALYNPESASFTYFADPGKVRNYLGAGVPVLITDVPQVASEIENESAGLVVKYDVESITSALTDTLSEPMELKKLRENAARLGDKYDWNLIFERLGLN